MSIAVMPSHRTYEARRVGRLSIPRAIEAIHRQQQVAGEFVHTQTPIPAFDQTHFHVSHDGRDLLIAVAPYNTLGRHGAEEQIELFFDPYHDHLGFFQFIFAAPPAAAEPSVFHHLPYPEATSTAFRWLRPKAVNWEEQALVNVVGVPDVGRWLFVRFAIADVFRHGPVCGFNVCRWRSAINETTSWNLASGNGFVDATAFGHLRLQGEAPLPRLSIERAALDGRALALSGTAEGLGAFELELADPLDRRVAAAVPRRGSGEGANGWTARFELPGEEAGRYRLYPRAGGAAVEPESFHFDLAPPARRRRFTVGMFYDVPDDLRDNHYTPDRLDAQFGRLADCGVRRLYWIDYGSTHQNPSFWQAVSANYRAAYKHCGDLLPLAVELAHRRGMELIGVFKPFDMGFTWPVFDAPAADRVAGPENRYSPVLREVADHPQATLSDHEGWRVEPGLPITRLRVVSESPLAPAGARLRTADVKLWTSADNKRYRPYRGKVVVKVAPERVPHRRFTPAGLIEEASGRGAAARTLWALELSGLRLNEPYVALSVTREGFAADARYFEFLEAFDAQGRAIRVHLNDGGGLDKGFDFLRVWAGWANQSERLLGRRVWKGEPIAALLRPSPRMLTMLEPAAEASRQVWLGYIRRLLEAGCDGADVRTLCHHNACSSWLLWSFAEPVRAVFRERFGREVEPCEEDYQRVRVLRGECYTQFVRDASALARQRGKRFGAHLECGVEVPVHLHTRMQLHLDWRRWIEEELVDELTLKYWGSQNPWIHEQVLPLARRQGVAVHICEPNFTLHGLTGIERGGRLTREARTAGFDGYAFYENMSYQRMNPAGVSLPVAHTDKAIRAAADAVAD